MPDDPEHLLDQIRDLIHDVKSQIQHGLRADGTGLAMMEARALSFFGQHPGGTQAELAVAAHRDKAQVARVVRELTERGLLERADVAGDRRSVGLRLTEQGRALHKRARLQRRKLAEHMVDGLSASELAQMEALVQRLRANVAKK